MENVHEIAVLPIGFVTQGRTAMEDDNWGAVTAVIELDAGRFSPDATQGLAEFSHLEVIFLLHLVDPQAVEIRARHPRNNRAWPMVGIFAQRPKARPNRLGLSRCRTISVEGLRITVEALDAIVGTPVLDLKPYMREFGPIGEVRQPAWASELMRDYYRP